MGQTTNPLSTEARALLVSYAINDAMNQLILSQLDRRAWRAVPPGDKANGHAIAAIFAHLHNNRLAWLKNSAPHLSVQTPRSGPLHMKQSAVCVLIVQVK